MYCSGVSSAAEDELAWENTLDKNTIAAYEDYNNGTTIGAHKDEAHLRIQNGLIYLGGKYAQENNVVEMENHLNKYLSTYPNGKDSGKAKQLMCDVYFKNAEQQSQTKQSYNQDEAVNFYQKASRVCNDKNDLNSKIKKSKLVSRNRTLFYLHSLDYTLHFGFVK